MDSLHEEFKTSVKDGKYEKFMDMINNHGCDVDVVKSEDDGQSVLLLSIRYNHKEIFDKILELSKDINKLLYLQTSKRVTPLKESIGKKRDYFTRKLLDLDYSFKHINNSQALVECVIKNNYTIFYEIVSKFNYDDYKPEEVVKFYSKAFSKAIMKRNYIFAIYFWETFEDLNFIELVVSNGFNELFRDMFDCYLFYHGHDNKRTLKLLISAIKYRRKMIVECILGKYPEYEPAAMALALSEPHYVKFLKSRKIEID